jgi:hypothetical protein
MGCNEITNYDPTGETMSIGTLLIIVFVIIPIAALLLLLVLCMAIEYLLYRSAQVQLKAMEQFWGDDEETEDDTELASVTILDYSGTSPK